MSPIPCAHCGHNFMRHSIDPETPKLCNNCKKPGKKDMNSVTIMIVCDRQTQIDIEEICINEGIDFSEYFLRLHKNKIETIPPFRGNTTEEIQEFIDKTQNATSHQKKSKVKK